MPKIYVSAGDLASAFPLSIRQDALAACATFPAARSLGQEFPVRVSGELVTIPYRLHLDTGLIHVDRITSLQRDIVDCLLTRHSDGLVRQNHLTRILRFNHAWVPPFVVQLAGEYVIEILNVIFQNLEALDASAYGEFLRNNPAFLTLTERRIVSYWDCYYRNETRKEYVGSRFLSFSALCNSRPDKVLFRRVCLARS